MQPVQPVRPVHTAPQAASHVQNQTLTCRQCGSSALRLLGPIPDATVFAGQALDPPWDGGGLYECSHCHVGLRLPIKPEGEFERLYAAASGQVWISEGLRVDQRRVVQLLGSKLSSGHVLDVGCYDGTLLQALAPALHKHGVELSAQAAELARQRGVNIMAARIAELDLVEQRFDAICAVDVIEHVPNPGAFVDTLARLLAPGGWLFVSTGALDARAWRWAAGQYWYGCFPEHISFISRAWAEQMAARTGLILQASQTFAYEDLAPRRRALLRLRFAWKLLRARLSAGASALRRARQRGKPLRSLGQPGVFADHLLLAYRKPGQTPT